MIALFERTHSGAVPEGDQPTLMALQNQRERLQAELRSLQDRMNASAVANHAELSPLTIWDSVAAELEKLVERLER